VQVCKCLLNFAGGQCFRTLSAFRARGGLRKFGLICRILRHHSVTASKSPKHQTAWRMWESEIGVQSQFQLRDLVINLLGASARFWFCE
jgi:hypothetical protein